MFTQDKVKDVRSENGCLVGKTEDGALAVYAPSLTTFLNHVKVAYPTPKRAQESDCSKRRNFNYYDNYKDAMAVYSERPWDVIKFDQVDHTLVSPDSAGSAVYFDVTGDYLDVGRYLDGEPEQFGNAYLGNPRGLFITIYASANAACGIPEASLRRKQERIVALIDWLESNNIRTRLTVINHNECCCVEVVVKEFHDPVDLAPIAVTFHPDYLRRIVFRVKEYSDTWNSWYGSSLSHITVDPTGLSVSIPSNQGGYDGKIDEVDAYFDKLIEDISKKIEEGDTLAIVGDTNDHA